MKTHKTYRIRWKIKGRKDCVHTKLLGLIVQGLIYQFYIESQQSGDLSTTVGSFARRQCSHIQLLKQRCFNYFYYYCIIIILWAGNIVNCHSYITFWGRAVSRCDALRPLPLWSQLIGGGGDDVRLSRSTVPKEEGLVPGNHDSIWFLHTSTSRFSPKFTLDFNCNFKVRVLYWVLDIGECLCNVNQAIPKKVTWGNSLPSKE